MPVALCTPTLSEQRLLDLRYDGPIPPHALGDLRATAAQPFQAAGLTDRELDLWARLARGNLKAAQRELVEWRKRLLAVRAVLTCPTAKLNALKQAQKQARWSLKQCTDARAEGAGFWAEARRRAKVARTLNGHMRVLSALNMQISPPGQQAAHQVAQTFR